MAWRRSGPHIVAQKTDSEVIVADLQAGAYHSISGSGPVMWDFIDKGHPRQRVVDMLVATYEASCDTIDKELTAFVDRLVAAELIKSSAAADTSSSVSHGEQTTGKRKFDAPAVVTYLSADGAFISKAKLVDWQRSAPHVVSGIVGEELLIVHAQKGISCKTSGSGVVVWQGIESDFSRDAIVTSVLSQYDTSADTAAQAVDEFITQLACLSLIQPRSADAPVGAHGTKDAACGQAKKAFARPAVTVETDRQAAIRLITRLNGWQVAAPQIVSETIDDEVIAVNLQDGVYHSITGAGTLIWEDIQQGQGCEQLVDTLLSHYEMTTELANQELDSFIEKLVEFNLIRPNQTKSERPATRRTTQSATRVPFAPPVMVIYNDMETVLRLDPVHDFDEYGWPGRV